MRIAFSLWCFTLSLGLITPVQGVAEGLVSSGSTSARAKIFDRQSKLLDSRMSSQYRGSTKLKPKSKKETPVRASVPRYTGSYKGTYLAAAKTVARKNGIPTDLFLRLVQQESGWNPTARSHKGAIGLAQLMPGTARKLGVDPHDPNQNLEGGARYLRMMHQKFGTWRLALAAYNAGPGAVEKYNGVPPYKETQNYVRIIHGH